MFPSVCPYTHRDVTYVLPQLAGAQRRQQIEHQRVTTRLMNIEADPRPFMDRFEFRKFLRGEPDESE